MSQKHYLMRIKDNNVWNDFRKKCIDLDVSILDGLDIAMRNFVNQPVIEIEICKICQEIICECHD
jgi:hypothetical protein